MALRESIARFGAGSPFTVLRTRLEGVDPDEVYSSVPYEKGSLFVALLERAVGRERFDVFLRRYIERFRFTSITTEELMTFLEAELPGRRGEGRGGRVAAPARGCPPTRRCSGPKRWRPSRALAQGWAGGARPDAAADRALEPQRAAGLPAAPAAAAGRGRVPLARRDAARSRGRGNYEILVEWLTIAAGSDYEPVFGRVREVLTTVGRMKYLRPLFGALGQHPRTRALAKEIFAAAAPSYHTLSRRVVESVMEKYDG